jgi:aminopeptidase
MQEAETLPLARAVYAQAVKKGALPYVEFGSAYMERDLMRLGTREQLDWVPEIQAYGIAEWADVYLSLRGGRNPCEFADIATDRFVAHRRAMGKVSALRTEHTRWVIARVPSEAFAQQAGMSLDQAMALFFDATLRDWPAESERSRRVRDLFQTGETVRIVGWETDLSFSTKGRTYVVGDGHINMPDGEVFTAPVEDSVEGQIAFEFPGVFAGQKVEGIRLTLEGGQVVEAKAERNEALLQELLRMDEGAQRVGEFGLGTNPGIQRFCADHFYDEKIGGTAHLALGRSYSQCGGLNQSALHWDIVKDLRQEGTIYLDGHKVFEKGAYLVEGVAERIRR